MMELQKVISFQCYSSLSFSLLFYKETIFFCNFLSFYSVSILIGLLLNNLGLSTNCEIVFDSSMSAFSPAVMDDTWYDAYYEKASRSQADATGSDSASCEFESFSAVKDSLEILGDHDSIHTNNLHLPSIPGIVGR